MRQFVRRARTALAAPVYGLALGLAVAAVVVLLPAVGVGPAVPAAARPPVPPGGPPPGARLVLAIHKGTSAEGPLLAEVTLGCDPDVGTHPNPAAACDALRRVDGRFEKLPSDSYLCPLYVDRVTGEATGRWRGRPVHYVRRATNRCMLARETGRVFAF